VPEVYDDHAASSVESISPLQETTAPAVATGVCETRLRLDDDIVAAKHKLRGGAVRSSEDSTDPAPAQDDQNFNSGLEVIAEESVEAEDMATVTAVELVQCTLPVITAAPELAPVEPEITEPSQSGVASDDTVPALHQLSLSTYLDPCDFSVHLPDGGAAAADAPSDMFVHDESVNISAELVSSSCVALDAGSEITSEVKPELVFDAPASEVKPALVYEEPAVEFQFPSMIDAPACDPEFESTSDAPVLVQVQASVATIDAVSAPESASALPAVVADAVVEEVTTAPVVAVTAPEQSGAAAPRAGKKLRKKWSKSRADPTEVVVAVLCVQREAAVDVSQVKSTSGSDDSINRRASLAHQLEQVMDDVNRIMDLSQRLESFAHDDSPVAPTSTEPEVSTTLLPLMEQPESTAEVI